MIYQKSFQNNKCFPRFFAYVNVGCHDNKETALDHMAEIAKEQEATSCLRHKPNPTGTLNRVNEKLGQFFIQKKK